MPNKKHLPTVFLGSSKEKSKELEILADLIRTHALVELWTDHSLWQAGDFVLESLLTLVPRCDFAVLIFSKDDLTESRGITLGSPRDNVVFEAGLFMSQIGRQRTLIVAPQGGEHELKVLSDFAGLNLIFYDVPADRADLIEALRPAAERIRQRISNLKRRSPREEFYAVSDAGKRMMSLVHEAVSQGKNAVVKNIALDMEMTWPFLTEHVIDKESVRDFTWRSLMIDPDSSVIRELSSATVDPAEARRKANLIKKWCKPRKDKLASRGVEFDCRKYESVPFVHGFLFNDEELLVTLCGLDSDGKLIARPNPYLRFVKGTEDHFLRAFGQWFDYHWEKNRRVWP